MRLERFGKDDQALYEALVFNEEAMRKNAEIGDEVTTIGGICGKIVGIKDENTLILETGSDRAKIRVKRWAIGSVDTVHDDQA